MRERIRHTPSEARLTFAKNLKAARIKSGFATARSLADALGVDVIQFMRYERAEVEPDMAMLVKICEALCVTPNELLGYSG